MLPVLASLAGSALGAATSLFGANKDRKMQKEFAQNGVQWKVADAEKAGVHPLFALGANTASFSPVGVGGADNAFSQMGQDVSRALSATSPEATKANAYSSAIQTLTLKRMSLENDLLASKIATINQPGTPPTPPSLGQRYAIPGAPMLPGNNGGGDLGLINPQPQKFTNRSPEAAWQEPASVTDVGFSNTVSGGYAPVMSNDVKERLEEDWPGMLWWNVRNRLLPSIGYGASEPYPAPEGKYWGFNPITGEYHLKTRTPPMRRRTWGR